MADTSNRGTWEAQMRERIASLPDSPKEPLVRRLREEKALPFAATGYWLGLADESPDRCRTDAHGIPLDPILAQAIPSQAEFEEKPCEAVDPLGESGHSPSPRLVHQYRSRILLRVTGECPVFCRHCFRRSLLSSERGFMNETALESMERYLEIHDEVREVLVSGGDPLTASDDKLEDLFARMRRSRPGIMIRLCTRAPVTLPDRVTDGLVSMLRRYRPLRVVIQTNHPRELSPEFDAAIGLILDAGIPVRSQSVLLRGINDDADTLEALFSGLARRSVDPYYLFQGDLARGTAHFRVPLSKGLALYAELRKRLSGMELPRYAIDAPGGGGKLFLPEGIAGREGDWWLLSAPDGSIRRYPEEP